jgi:hypothetical protein
VYNGIWGDMAINTIYMRLGHSDTIWIILKPDTWAYRRHTCNIIIHNLNLKQ